jgi:hypothetical protein
MVPLSIDNSEPLPQQGKALDMVENTETPHWAGFVMMARSRLELLTEGL